MGCLRGYVDHSQPRNCRSQKDSLRCLSGRSSDLPPLLDSPMRRYPQLEEDFQRLVELEAVNLGLRLAGLSPSKKREERKESLGSCCLDLRHLPTDKAVPPHVHLLGRVEGIAA